MIASGKSHKSCSCTNQETCKCSSGGITPGDRPTDFKQIGRANTADATVEFPEWIRDLVIRPNGEREIRCIMCGERPPRKNGKPGDKPICERCYQKYKNRRFQ